MFVVCVAASGSLHLLYRGSPYGFSGFFFEKIFFRWQNVFFQNSAEKIKKTVLNNK